MTLDCQAARSKLDDIYLLIEYHWMQISTEDYIIDISNPGIGLQQNCELGFEVNRNENADMWVLGAIFHRGYYARFDLAEGKIGLAPNTSGRKQAFLVGEIPEETLRDGVDAWLVLWIALPIILVITFAIVLYCYCQSDLLTSRPADDH